MRIVDMCITLLIVLAPPAARADNPSLPQHTPALDAAGVESFLDNYLPKAMAARHIPGLVITIVKGGEPLVTKGYGVADIKTGRPVNPNRTLFDVQSVSKLFVSAAVMVARTEGAVRLHVNINRYLKGFRIPATYKTPITLASLMTHTSGLQDRGIGISARTPAQVQPLGKYLARTLTRRVAPPFTDLLYSDQGMSLAAYTVQSATGVPYKTFVQRHLFDPLSMHHSFFMQVPAKERSDKSSAYAFEDGRLVRIPHYYYNIWPTSSLWTTAADMSHFIAMQLQDGMFDGRRILSKAAIRLLHTRHFSYDPRMPGVCYDFFEHFENGRRLLIHSGGGSGFISELMLMPAEHVGWFFSYNGYDGSLIAAFRSAFLDRFFPAPVPHSHIETIHLSHARLEHFDGWYWATRYDRDSLGKLSSLLGGYLHVTATAKGLSIGSRLYSPVTHQVFVNQEKKVPDYVAFRRNPAGKVTELLSADAEAPYYRVSWIYSQPAQLGMLALAALGFVVVLLYTGATGAFALGKRPGRLAAAWTRRYLFAVSAANLVCFGLLLTRLIQSGSPSGAVSFEVGLSSSMWALLTATTVFALASLGSPVAAIVACRRGQRLWASIAAAASLTAIGYVWFLVNWNIVIWAA